MGSSQHMFILPAMIEVVGVAGLGPSATSAYFLLTASSMTD
jgi:hypothetical protein